MSDNTNVSGIADFNGLQYAGLGLASVTAGGVAAIGLAVAPAQVLGATAVAGGLYYAGTRQRSGEPLLPWIGGNADAPAAPAA